MFSGKATAELDYPSTSENPTAASQDIELNYTGFITDTISEAVGALISMESGFASNQRLAQMAEL